MKNLFDGTFADKTVLVTGHTGFKGSWLSIWLGELGSRVVGYSLDPPSVPSHFALTGLEKRIAHVHGDVRDGARLREALAAHRPDFVFHLAAQPIVRTSYAQTLLTYETNVMGTVNLLEALRSAPSVRACLVVTSDKCYENREWVYAYRENDPLGGRDPYSSSKACAEIVTSAYRRSFFEAARPDESLVALATARAGNVVGGGDWALDRLIPDCVRALSQGERITIRNPDAIRPWQHVLETLSGYLCLAALMWRDNRSYSDSWNFGPSSEGNLTVGDLAERVVRLWGGGGWSADQTKEAVGRTGPLKEAAFLKLDSTKARNLLGWRPVLDIDEALEATIRWYADHYRSTRPPDYHALTLGQIREYVKQAGDLGLPWAGSGGRT